MVWTAAAVVAPAGHTVELLHEPLWLIVLLAPLVAAGVNLIAFRRSHEEACRLEAGRHRWLRFMVGSGYSARTFAVTGVALLMLVAGIVARLVTGAL